MHTYRAAIGVQSGTGTSQETIALKFNAIHFIGKTYKNKCLMSSSVTGGCVDLQTRELTIISLILYFPDMFTVLLPAQEKYTPIMK